MKQEVGDCGPSAIRHGSAPARRDALRAPYGLDPLEALHAAALEARRFPALPHRLANLVISMARLDEDATCDAAQRLVRSKRGHDATGPTVEASKRAHCAPPLLEGAQRVSKGPSPPSPPASLAA